MAYQPLWGQGPWLLLSAASLLPHGGEVCNTPPTNVTDQEKQICNNLHDSWCAGMNSAFYQAPETALGEQLCGWHLTAAGEQRTALKTMLITHNKTHSAAAPASTWMILESSSKELLQSPQYSCASCRMYRFTLAEVELIPPEVPESSCNPEGRGQPSTGRWPHPGPVSASDPEPSPNTPVTQITCGFSGAASFTLQSRFSSCGRCPISW